MSETRTLLYGADEERFIVAIESPQDRPDLVQVYVQQPDGSVKPYHDKFVPFIYTKWDENVLVDARDVTVVPLLGGNPLNARVHGSWRTLGWIRKYASDSYLPHRKSQYAIHTGKTLFKGMDFDDILRLYVDIEVLTSEGFDFPNPDRYGDKVIIISMLTNKGEEIVLHGDDEKVLLQEFIKEFRRIDPTVVVGHNIFNFDLPYLETRFLMHGIDFALGRNGSAPQKFITNIKLAEKDKEYTNWQVWGRHVMDTMFMAMQWDVVQRKLDSYSLKDIAKTLGFASEDREYVEGSEITRVWFTDRERLIRYALDDVRETRQIDLTMGGAVFYLTQMLPMSLQDAWRYGTGTKIDSMFVREYYRQDWSLPLASPKQDYGGGYAEARVTGLTSGRIAGIDVASLYPTIMETANVISHKDELDMFGTVLRVLKKERLRIKKAAKTFKDQGMTRQAQMEDSRQNSMKLVINSMYGWLGWEFGMFNDYDEAARVTTIGQSIIKKMIEVAEGYGSVAIKADSVTEKTPIYIRHKESGLIDIISIGTFHNIIANGSDKMRSVENVHLYQTMTRGGWADILYTYKHETTKKIYRVNTKIGYVEVTEDHSLFQNGHEVSPEKLTEGEELDHYSEKIKTTKVTSIHPDVAWLLGFLVSDGSASRVRRKTGGFSTNISIAKSNKELLLKAKDILEFHFNIKTSFYDTKESSGCFKLIGGYNKKDFDTIFNLIYDPYTKEKKIPTCIINSNHQTMEAFLSGMLSGDGSVIKGLYENLGISIPSKSQITIAGMSYLFNCLGVKNLNVQIRDDKPNFLTIRALNGHRKERKSPTVIKKLRTLDYDGPVYDISTTDGTFLTAIGNMILHNTDGLLMTVPELWMDAEGAYTEMIQDAVNAWYPGGGIEIEHDGNYAKALIVDDKSYVLLGLDDSIKIKGNTLKSRSMEPFCRAFLDSCIRAVMEGRPEEVRDIYDQMEFKVGAGLLDLSDIISKRELNQSIEEYKNKRAGGGNPIAQYEVACKSKRPLRKGDRVTYYIRRPNKTLQLVRNKLVERDEVLPTSALATEASDYNFDYFEKHYLKRLVAVTKRLLVILGEDTFRATFPEIRLNKKDLEKINKEEEED
jgi:DNA polymerase elongation subunit (family B)